MLNNMLGEPESQPRSAQESFNREQRALQAVSTLASVIQTEYLGPLIQKVVMKMLDAGELPGVQEVGERTGGRPAQLRLLSPFFTAQKASTAQVQRDYVVRRLQLAQLAGQIDPALAQSLLDDLNFDGYAKVDAELSDTQAKIFVSEGQKLNRREARAEEIAAQGSLGQEDLLAQQNIPDLLGG